MSHDDIRVGDPEFDQQIDIQGSPELQIQCLLTHTLRNKFLSLGESTFKINNTTLAHFEFHHSIKILKQNVDHFYYLINTMIDIIEQVEASASSK